MEELKSGSQLVDLATTCGEVQLLVVWTTDFNRSFSSVLRRHFLNPRREMFLRVAVWSL